MPAAEDDRVAVAGAGCWRTCRTGAAPSAPRPPARPRGRCSSARRRRSSARAARTGRPTGPSRFVAHGTAFSQGTGARMRPSPRSDRKRSIVERDALARAASRRSPGRRRRTSRRRSPRGTAAGCRRSRSSPRSRARLAAIASITSAIVTRRLGMSWTVAPSRLDTLAPTNARATSRRVLELGRAPVGDRVGDARGRCEHRRRRRRGQSLVAADPVDRVRAQADARRRRSRGRRPTPSTRSRA